MINKALNTANEKTGAKKEHLAVIGVLLPVLLMISLGGAHFIIDLVAYLYPAYASVKAIETDDPEDDTMWLTYWLVFSLFKLVEGIADSLLHYIPFYAIAKCCFLIWCFHPSFKGSKIIYDSCIAPYKEFLFIDKKAKKQ
jgi:receptor expression-enhancing protein 5/6|tara:strand:- start:163 stop:582 length:420 start_codon:yes stop_codon:yes gene_type:complete